MLQSAALECCAVCHGRREESAEESAEESWSIVKYSFTDIGEFGLGREWQIYFFYSRSFESGYSLSEYPLDCPWIAALGISARTYYQPCPALRDQFITT